MHGVPVHHRTQEKKNDNPVRIGLIFPLLLPSLPLLLLFDFHGSCENLTHCYLLVVMSEGHICEIRCVWILQEGDRRVKMQNMVHFPLIGMDMAPHMVKRSQSSWSLPSHWSPWRRPYGLGRNSEDYLYDLYAVCNHHGNMHGGHYTGNISQKAWSLCMHKINSYSQYGRCSAAVIFHALALEGGFVQPGLFAPLQHIVRTP